MSLTFDGANGSRLRQTTEIELGIGQSFSTFAWSALLRVNAAAAGATILAKRSAAASNTYDMFWRINRWNPAGDSDSTYHRRVSFVHDDNSGLATHYADSDGGGGLGATGITSTNPSPLLELGQWYAVGGWVDYTRIVANSSVCTYYLNGTAYTFITGDTIGTPTDANVVVSIGGLMGSPTTNQAQITLASLAIWNSKPSAATFAALHGVTNPGVYESPMAYSPTHYYTLANTTMGLVDQVGGNNLILDGGVTTDLDPVGVTYIGEKSWSIFDDGLGNTRTITGASNATKPYLLNAGYYVPIRPDLATSIDEGNQGMMPKWIGGGSEFDGRFLTAAELDRFCQVVWREWD